MDIKFILEIKINNLGIKTLGKMFILVFQEHKLSLHFPGKLSLFFVIIILYQVIYCMMEEMLMNKNILNLQVHLSNKKRIIYDITKSKLLKLNITQLLNIYKQQLKNIDIKDKIWMKQKI